jgi:hypothetical protein
MTTRCTFKGHRSYKDYGGRGITVCDRWLGDHGFENFLADMGPNPGPGHSLERKDNSKGYSQDNCVWATKAEQDRNKRNNVWLSYNGETLIMSDWAKRLGMSPQRLRSRLLYSPVEQVLAGVVA